MMRLPRRDRNMYGLEECSRSTCFQMPSLYCTDRSRWTGQQKTALLAPVPRTKQEEERSNKMVVAVAELIAW